jgi:hypothetical protein
MIFRYALGFSNQFENWLCKSVLCIALFQAAAFLGYYLRNFLLTYNTESIERDTEIFRYLFIPRHSFDLSITWC